MAWVLIRLKLRLLSNGLAARHGRAWFVGGAAAGLALGCYGFVQLARIPTTVGNATDLLVLLFVALVMAWISAALSSGTDQSPSPGQLALFPLSRLQLVGALFGASAVGTGPLVAFVALTGLTVSTAHVPRRFLLALAAVLVEILFAVAASRAIASLLGGLLRSRRGRDLSGAVILLLGGPIVASLLVARGTDHSVTPAAIAQVVEMLRWTPPGMAAMALGAARQGHLASAVLELAGATSGIFAMLLAWTYSLSRSLVTPEGGTVNASAGRAGSLCPTVLRTLLPRTRTGAVAARELRYAWREPMRKTMWVTSLTFGTTLALLHAFGARGADPGSLFWILAVPLFVGQVVVNQWGLDGAPLWLHLQSGSDVQADLMGKNLATAIIAGPHIVLVALALAFLRDDWSYFSGSVAMALGVLGLVLGVGDIVSVTLPHPTAKDTTNGMVLNAGQGATFAFAKFVLVAGVALLAAPMLALAHRAADGSSVGLLLLVPLAPTYGGIVGWRLMRSAGRSMSQRGPELLEKVSLG